ncbi:MAG: leucine-rich repeat domain-containing protein [Clostridiales bacterium]|nr:leucine-rich repeat domain-containing protein [Clostridiales bacterium]
MMKSKWLKALAVTACLTLATGFAVACKEDTASNAIYTKNATEDGYVLTYYNAAGAVEIPSEYNGLPVVEIGLQAFKDCSGLTSVVIPDSVKKISAEAFYNCSALSSVTLGDGVEHIGNGAFGLCSALTEIEIPASVKKMGDDQPEYNGDELLQSQWGGVFYNCDNLKSIRVHADSNDYKSVDGNLYTKDGTVLVQYAVGKTETSFAIPDTVATVGRFAFGGNDYLEEVTIPDSVTIAGEGVFYRCSKLETVTIGSGLKRIARWAFYDCDKIANVTIPATLDTEIGERSFYSCDALTEITIPNAATITEKAFLSCVNLKKVTMGFGVSVVGTFSFEGCTSLSELTMPNVKKISEGAFKNGKSLTEVTLPAGVFQVGPNIFAGCDKLTIYCELYNEADENGEYPTPSNWDLSWKTCDADKGIFCPVVWNSEENSVADDGYIYEIVNGVRYKLKDGVATVTGQAISIEEAIIVPEISYMGKKYSVKEIEENAFYNCSNVTKIVIPQSVETIGSWAFFGCYELTIYCEAQSQPISWGDAWNLSNTPVVWGYTGE